MSDWNVLSKELQGPAGEQPAKVRLVAGMFDAISDAFKRSKSARESLEDRVKAAEERIAELERRPAVAYRGVWDAAVVYQRGVFVTYGGSLWHCNETCSNARPGDGSAIWTLAAKKGRDAR